MNKKIFAILLLSVFLFSFASAAITVDLNSPADDSTTYTFLNTFNATATVTGGATLTNMSLWTNETGSWGIRNTTSDSDLTWGSYTGEFVSQESLAISDVNENLNYVLMKSFTAVGNSTKVTGEYGVDSGGGGVETKYLKITWTYNDTTTGDTTTDNTGDFGGAIVYTGFSLSNPNPFKNVDSIAIYMKSTDTGGSMRLKETKVYSATMSGGSNDTQTFSRTITDDIIWNVQACDSDGDCGFAGSNYSLFLDTTAPTITIESPITIYDYLYQNYNITLNTTITDVNLDTCWYDYNNTNTTFSCSTGVKTTNYFNYQPNYNNITIWANDSVSNKYSNFTSWNIKISENSRTLNSTSYETKSEAFSIKITANSSLTAVTLDYNGTEYATTKSGTVYSKTFDIPIGLINRSVRWKFTYAGESIYSTYSYQNVLETRFNICNGTYTDQYLNISFKDEEDSKIINATIPTSTFTYYLGSGTVNKSYTYINTSLNYNYLFCATPSQTLSVLPVLQYKSGTDYPQRIWQPGTETYTTTSSAQTLYLLSSIDGIYVTFQVINSAEQILSGVDINATRVIDGANVVVGVGTTSSAGTVTFWLNPDFSHTFGFSKSGYTTYVYSDTPTQASYTITLSSGGESTNDYLKGMKTYVYPKLSELFNDTSYNFIFNMTSSYWELDSFGFNLRLKNGTIITGDTSTVEGSGANIIYDVNNQSIVYMDYYWIVGGNYTYGSSYWIVTDTSYSGWSIKTLFTDLQTYLDSGLFGLDNFGRILIMFIVLFVSVGIMSYKYGMTSPLAITTLIFAIVFFLDIVVGLIPAIRGIDYLLTYLAGVILVGTVIGEMAR